MLSPVEIQEAHRANLSVKVPAINLLNIDSVGYLIMAYLFIMNVENVE